MTAYLANAKQHTVSPNMFILMIVDEALTDGQHTTLESVRNAVRQLVPPVDLNVTLRWTHGPVEVLQHSRQLHRRSPKRQRNPQARTKSAIKNEK